MTFEELTDSLAKEFKISKRKSRLLSKKLFSTMREEVIENGRVYIPKFGVFEVKEVQTRVRRNPKSGELKEIEGYTKVKFKPHKTLKRF